MTYVILIILPLDSAALNYHSPSLGHVSDCHLCIVLSSNGGTDD